MKPQSENKKQIDIFGYASAWIKYAGEFLVRLSNIGAVIRESFADIHPPQKDEFTK